MKKPLTKHLVCAEYSMLEDRKAPYNYSVRDLWFQGKFWEIFDFTSNDFTALELAKRYSALRKVYEDSPEQAEIIESAFAILNAPLTRQFYVGCRTVMQRIREGIGNSSFEDAESQIWSDLWGWVSKRWQVPTDELVTALESKYAHGAVAEVSGIGLDEESLGIDSVMTAESFAQEVKCQSCGKFDHTLRVVAFPYVVSILIASFRRVGESGIFCHGCRCTKSLKWAVVSLLFGWWSIWGFFWNIGALIDNFRGGKMPRENNEPLLAKLAWANMVLGQIAEAKAALKDLLKYGPNGEAIRLRQELDRNYPTVSPATTGGFRLGYLSVVFTVLVIYVIAGLALFGGPSEPSVNSPPVQPSPVTPSQTTPATTPGQTPVTLPESTPLIPPEDSFVKWDDSSGWTTESSITISGSVRNTHYEWSIRDVRVEVELLDTYGKIVQRDTVYVSPSMIPPGGTGNYYDVLRVPPACDNGNTIIYWVWLPPE